MRYLLALILLPAAFGQQPDTPAKTEEKAAAPAKTEEKAAASAPASPAPAPAGEQWFAGSLDLGYRWLSNVNGSFPEYRSVVNLGEGLKLNGLEFTILDPKKRLFERVDASAHGFGGDPYTTARLNARKKSVYEFTLDYRNIAYFNAVPSYANPLAPAGFNEQAFDTHRRSLSIGLDLRPGKRIIPYLAFDRNSGYGHGVDTWVQDSNDEFAVPTLLRDSTDNYRGGVRVEYNLFHVTLEQGGTTFKDDDQSSWSGSNLGDRTSPIFGQTLKLTSLNQAYGVRGSSVYTKLLTTAHPAPWIDLYGQFLYSDPSTKVNFNETANGNFALLSQLLFYSSQQTMGTGYANQPHTTATVGFEMRPLRGVRIFQSWMTDRYHDAASPALSLAASIPLTNNVGLDPLQVVNYNQEQVDVLWDVDQRFTLRGGFRHIWGSATAMSAPLSQSGTFEYGQLSRNVALAGLNFHASQKLSVNLDYEGGGSDHVYFRTSLNDYQMARARGKYQLSKTISLQANTHVLNNRNHAADIQYDLLSRDTSLAAYWLPAGGKRISFMGEYDRSTVHSNIAYLALPLLTRTASDYRDNAHTLTAAVDLVSPGAVAAKLTVGGSLFLSNGSRTSNYYQPLARLSFPLGKHVYWNTEWKYYGYREDFYLYEGFRTHLFMTGMKLIR